MLYKHIRTLVSRIDERYSESELNLHAFENCVGDFLLLTNFAFSFIHPFDTYTSV